MGEVFGLRGNDIRSEQERGRRRKRKRQRSKNKNRRCPTCISLDVIPPKCAQSQCFGFCRKHAKAIVDNSAEVKFAKQVFPDVAPGITKLHKLDSWLEILQLLSDLSDDELEVLFRICQSSSSLEMHT